MGRPKGKQPAEVRDSPADEWPSWVLTFGHGLPSDRNSDRWIAVMRDHARWLQRRREWFEANVGPWSPEALTLLNREHRRRAGND